LSREEILEKLGDVFQEVFDRPVELREDTTAAGVDGWDSIAHVTLILATEDEFGVRFDSSEIANAADVGEFVSLIESKRRQ
jgi:acyl carrier protein